VSFLILNNLIHYTKGWYFFVVFEDKNACLPNLLDGIKLLFDFVLLLGSIDNFSDFLSIFKELKLNKVLKAELWILEFDVFLSNLHKFFPMSLHHEFGMKLRNQRKDGVHVLNFVNKRSECSPVLDVFVLCGDWTTLFSLHIFNQLHEVLSVNLVPKSFLPIVKLILNKSNHVPCVFKENQFCSAVLKLLVGRLLDIKKNFEIVELRCFFFKSVSLGEVQFNLCISSKD